MDGIASVAAVSDVTAAVHLCLSGVGVCLAVLTSAIAFASHNRGQYIAYSVSSFCAAVGCMAAAVETRNSYLQSGVVTGLISLQFLFIPAFAWFLILYTRLANPLPWLAGKRLVESKERSAIPLLAVCVLLALIVVACDAQVLGGAYSGSISALARMAMLLITGASLALGARSTYYELQLTTRSLEAANEAHGLAQAQLREMAFHDSLTGFPNRNHFNNEILALIGSEGASHGHAAMLVGLDNFKIINSALGRRVGNRLLRLVGERLRNALPPDTLVARLDGDEFGVLLQGFDPRSGLVAERVASVARDLHASLARSFAVEGHELAITVSIGLTLLPAESDSPELVLQRAALALNSAKEAGGDVTKSFHSGIRNDVERRHSMEMQLRQAIERNEFELWMQPKVDGRGAIAGAEALLRWKRRGERYVSPAEFIPLAEETGMIHSIGDWVLDQALCTLALWQKNGLDLNGRLAVNISPWQLRRKGFDLYLDGRIKAFGLSPRSLILEITEGALLDWSDDLLGVLCRLRASGVEISLDDFGIGFSSLSYLQRLPLDELKVDRAFVAGIANGVATPLLCSIVEIARSHGLRSVAEGVETPEQHEALVNLGCDLFQGFYFGRPVPGASFAELLGKRGLPDAIDKFLQQTSSQRCGNVLSN
jgi:diguanylate cyclase (GGDEF)-like protein